MGILALVFALVSVDTEEFRTTANQQMKDGYEWNYVGPTDASGVPALLINDKYYLWKLKK